jgi:hypothetical protein
MNSKELSNAATNLWYVLDDVRQIYSDVEDESGGLGRHNRELDKKFSRVMELLDDLAISLHRADPDRTNMEDIPPFRERTGS